MKRDWSYSLFWKSMARFVLHSEDAYYGMPIPSNTNGRHALALDLGVGEGIASNLLRKHRWVPVGIDRSLDSARLASGAGIPSLIGDVARLPFADDVFSLALASHIIEHVPNPLTVLDEIYRVLEPGGVLILTAPNFDSPDRSLFGPYWYELSAPRHLVHFNPRSLSLALTRAPWSIQRLTTTPGLSFSGSLMFRLGVPYSRITGSRLIRGLEMLGFPVDFLNASLGRGANLLAIAAKPTEPVS